MPDTPQLISWPPGSAPVAVVMISLNEGHNIVDVLDNLKGWAQEVFLVDSYSQDETVDVALRYGVHVVQRRFCGFGEQWNFALRELPISAPWTMKLDPDERLTEELKHEIVEFTRTPLADACYLRIRLFFMGKALSVRYRLLRLWLTGKARMSNVLVNEHISVNGEIAQLSFDVEHHDSPDLEHWFEKQNRYTTAEALTYFNQSELADTPRLFGTSFQRRMWIKKHFFNLPLRYFLLFLYLWLWQGNWRSGWVGYAWSRLRTDVMRMKEYKAREIRLTGRLPTSRLYGAGRPDPRVKQYT